MSGERTPSTPTPPPSWGEEAQGLASRYAIASGVAITFVLFGLIIIPSLVRERQAAKALPSDQPAAASVGWLDQAEVPPSKGKDLPPVDPATVMTATPKLLARGEVLFKQNCTSCHGDAGRGDGPAVATLNPKPRNFTQPDKWTRGYRITDIFTTVTLGVKGTGMAPFDFIVPADRMALVHYARSLGSFDHGPEDAKATEELAQQFRSKGVHIPNRIPVSLAIKKMVQEQAQAPALKLPAEDDKSPAAELLRAVIADPVRASRTVAATTDRTDRRAVARAWVAGGPGNGFAPALAGMSMAEWQEISRALLGAEDVAPAASEEQAKQP
ncbi:MAG TPA: c-type cytochrome [Polyangia bacterium]